jgi:outer membrane receptor for monomeric catechols
VGKYFVEGETWIWDWGQRTDNTRATIAHELDVGKWGRYRFAGMGEYEWRSFRMNQIYEVWDGAPFHASPENAANVVRRRNYVTFGDWDSFYRSMPLETGLLRGVPDPIVPGRTLNSTFLPRNPSQTRDNPENQTTFLLAAQARYFKNRLVLGAGYRQDKLNVLTRGTTRDADNVITTDYSNNTFAEYDGKTKTLGAVLHATKNISVFYNYSNNFSLPPNIFLVPDGKRASNPEGQGTDYGISIDLFDGKVSARASYFKTDLVNGAASAYGGSTTAPDAVGDFILNALVDAGRITAAEADTHRVVNTGSTFGRLVEGYEVTLVANPTRNWRLQANFSYTDGYTSEVAPEVQEWAARELPFFKRFDQSIVTQSNLRTIGEVLEAWEEYNNQQLDFVGLALAGNRKYKANLFTSYSFSQGMLRGLTVGGGYRHQSKIPIGQYADGSLQYGPSYWDSHAMIGYSFRRTPLPWLKRLRVQLNVQNLFNEDEAYILRRGPADAAFRNVIGPQDATEIVRRTRMREPRTWRLSANFDF